MPQGRPELVVGCASVQQQTTTPLLQRAQLAAAVAPGGGGCRAPTGREATPQAQEMVLLHWGNNKPDKGLEEALSLLETMLDCSAAERPKWPLLFHCYASQGLSEDHSNLLDEAQRQLGHQLIVLSDQVSDRTMQRCLGSAPSLMAYNPITYSERSSGVFWCYAAAHGRGKPRTGLATGTWLQREAEALGMAWRSRPIWASHKPSGAQWLEASTPRQWRRRTTPNGSPKPVKFWAKALLNGLPGN